MKHYFLGLIVIFVLSCSSSKKIKNVINIDYKDSSATYKLKLKKISVIDLEFKEKDPLNIITEINIDDKRNIYILDWRGGNIKKYTKDGKHIKNIGRPGQGPGEFVTPLSFCISNDTIYVCDIGLMRISAFSINGDYISSFKINTNYIVGKGLICDGRHLYLQASNAKYNYKKNPLIVNTFIKMDMNGNVIEELGRYDDIYNKYDLANYYAVFPASQIVNNFLYYSNMAYYKIYKIDLETGEIYKFGIKSKFFRDLVDSDKYNSKEEYWCKTTSLKEPFILNNKYVLIENLNTNKSYSINGKLRYSNGNKTKSNTYLQVYSINNKSYLGEIQINSMQVICTFKDYIYMKKSIYNKDQIIIYQLIDESK